MILMGSLTWCREMERWSGRDGAELRDCSASTRQHAMAFACRGKVCEFSRLCILSVAAHDIAASR